MNEEHSLGGHLPFVGKLLLLMGSYNWAGYGPKKWVHLANVGRSGPSSILTFHVYIVPNWCSVVILLKFVISLHAVNYMKLELTVARCSGLGGSSLKSFLRVRSVLNLKLDI